MMTYLLSPDALLARDNESQQNETIRSFGIWEINSTEFGFQEDV